MRTVEGVGGVELVRAIAGLIFPDSEPRNCGMVTFESRGREISVGPAAPTCRIIIESVRWPASALPPVCRLLRWAADMPLRLSEPTIR